MACRPNEMAILKALSAYIDNDNIMLLTLMYHTEPHSGPDTILAPNGKAPVNHTKSWYKYYGRIIKKADLDNMIADAKAHSTDEWFWPNEPDFAIAGHTKSSRADEANWLRLKAKKAVDWPTAEKILNGWKRASNDFKDSRKYPTTGYTTDTGKTLDLTLENLKALGPNHTFTKALTKKA